MDGIKSQTRLIGNEKPQGFIIEPARNYLRLSLTKELECLVQGFDSLGGLTWEVY